MATELQVTCTVKDGPDNDRRIDAIGGTGWKTAADQAIAAIKANRTTYYTMVNGVRANVLVKKHATSGREYLTTSPDGVQPNNLLKLPNCP